MKEQRIRVSQTSKTKHYIQKLNEYIDIAKKKGSCVGKPEEGLIYWIAYRSEPSDEPLKSFNSAPLYFSLNARKFAETACLPFIKIFQRTTDYLAFLKGEMVIIMLLEIDLLKRYAFEQGYDMINADEPEFSYFFRPHEMGKQSFYISDHMVTRFFLECYSPKWFIKETIDFINHPTLPDQLNVLDQNSSHAGASMSGGASG
ncbi:MAG: hypothetical protein H7289_06745 [Mucilaginibacter sp.]|nr:hypothetical protein [Mucilaginibacter sp.]